mmetsp:Transcript_114099/g.363773  ORF Transcript_114099/g.363773 Transcript_114099/m.363773 type:complete len:392 (+) Transcript_114099:1038-2213(+)
MCSPGWRGTSWAPSGRRSCGQGGGSWRTACPGSTRSGCPWPKRQEASLARDSGGQAPTARHTRPPTACTCSWRMSPAWTLQGSRSPTTAGSAYPAACCTGWASPVSALRRACSPAPTPRCACTRRRSRSCSSSGPRASWPSGWCPWIWQPSTSSALGSPCATSRCTAWNCPSSLGASSARLWDSSGRGRRSREQLGPQQRGRVRAEAILWSPCCGPWRGRRPRPPSSAPAGASATPGAWLSGSGRPTRLRSCGTPLSCATTQLRSQRALMCIAGHTSAPTLATGPRPCSLSCPALRSASGWGSTSCGSTATPSSSKIHGRCSCRWGEAIRPRSCSSQSRRTPGTASTPASSSSAPASSRCATWPSGSRSSWSGLSTSTRPSSRCSWASCGT